MSTATTAGPSGSHLAELKRASAAFQARFVRASSAALAAFCVLMIVAGIARHDHVWLASTTLGLVSCATAYAFTYRREGILGGRVFVYGLIAGSSNSILFDAMDGHRFAAYVGVTGLLVALAGFLLTRVDLWLTLALTVAMLVMSIVRLVLLGDRDASHLALSGVSVGIVLTLALAVSLFTAHARDNQARLYTYVDEVDRGMEHAARIAKGDLAGTIEGESEAAGTIRAMQDGLRTLVSHTRETAAALSASAQEIAAMARQQEQGAVEQASAVEQVHKTLATLLEGSNAAAESTGDVLRSAEMTQRTSEIVAQRAGALSSHTRRISALLEVIKNIANKSEILALNAALEGARAGEAGRGFSLVASQMQRLAESVMDSVRDVRALVEDIDAATSATLAATEESTRLSATATTAARQISGTLQQQRRSTEQVTSAMFDIQQVTAQVSVGSSQALDATRDLTHLSGELKRAIERFVI